MRQEILTSAFITLRKRLQRFAARFVGNSEAEDVVHDAFVKLWIQHPDIRDHITAAKLVYKSVRNSAIDNIRYKDSHPGDISETVEDPNYLNLSDEDEETYNPDPEMIRNSVIELSLKILNDRQSEVFRLHDLSGWDYDDIASHLQMSPENVRMTLSRARKAIREFYKQRSKIIDEN